MFQEVVRDREKAENEQLERFQRLEEDLIGGLTVVVEKLTCGSKSMADHNKIIKRTATGEGEEVWQPHFQSWRRKLDIPVFAGEEAFGWTNRLERYFRLKEISEEETMQAVVIVLEGKALN